MTVSLWRGISGVGSGVVINRVSVASASIGFDHQFVRPRTRRCRASTHGAACDGIRFSF